MIRHANDSVRDAEFIALRADSVLDAVDDADDIWHRYYVIEFDKRVQSLSNDAYARLCALVDEIAGDFDLLLLNHRQRDFGPKP